LVVVQVATPVEILDFLREDIQTVVHLAKDLVVSQVAVHLAILQEDTQVVAPLVLALVGTPVEEALAFLQEDTQVVVRMVRDLEDFLEEAHLEAIHLVLNLPVEDTAVEDLVYTPVEDFLVVAILVDQVEVVIAKEALVATESKEKIITQKNMECTTTQFQII